MLSKSLYAIRTFIVLIGFVGLTTSPLVGQKGSFNYENKYSKKNYYFGIALGTNFSKYRIEKSQSLINNDSVRTVNANFSPGFSIGFIANFGLNKNLDFRLLTPTVVFSDKTLIYEMTNDQIVEQKIESVLLEFPVYFRYKSKPYNDVRLFVMAGIKYSVDLSTSSNRRSAAETLKLDMHDLAVELGLGFQVFFPFFILSPEIKFSYGVFDLHRRNEALVVSSVIDKVFSRGFSISLNFEG